MQPKRYTYGTALLNVSSATQLRARDRRPVDAQTALVPETYPRTCVSDQAERDTERLGSGIDIWFDAGPPDLSSNPIRFGPRARRPIALWDSDTAGPAPDSRVWRARPIRIPKDGRGGRMLALPSSARQTARYCLEMSSRLEIVEGSRESLHAKRRPLRRYLRET
jgi:hypothetical protein